MTSRAHRNLTLETFTQTQISHPVLILKQTPSSYRTPIVTRFPTSRSAAQSESSRFPSLVVHLISKLLDFNCFSATTSHVMLWLGTYFYRQLCSLSPNGNTDRFLTPEILAGSITQVWFKM